MKHERVVIILATEQTVVSFCDYLVQKIISSCKNSLFGFCVLIYIYCPCIRLRLARWRLYNLVFYHFAVTEYFSFYEKKIVSPILLLIGVPTNFETDHILLSIIRTSLFKHERVKVLSKWRPFCDHKVRQIISSCNSSFVFCLF